LDDPTTCILRPARIVALALIGLKPHCGGQRRPRGSGRGDRTVDLAAKRVTTADGEVRLTPTEWHIVEVLIRNVGKLVTQRQLLQEVWGPQYEKDTNYLRVYLAQIRGKLEPDPAYNGSDPAQRAIEHAAGLVGKGGTLTVINVISAQSVSSRLETVSDNERATQDHVIQDAERLGAPASAASSRRPVSFTVPSAESSCAEPRATCS
jgi:Transcriptional regulatory protein, C terminal